MKKLFQLSVSLLVIFLFITCSKDDNNKMASIDGVFIGVNNDNRIPGLYDIEDTYRVDLSSYAFVEKYYEPSGVQFVMEIWDKNREFIGGIGGINSCQVIELYIDVYKNDFNSKTQVETFTGDLSKAEKQDKCNLYIRLKDINRNPIMAGNAIDGQNITVEYKNGEYYVEFSNLKVESNDGIDSFTTSGRIITN